MFDTIYLLIWHFNIQLENSHQLLVSPYITFLSRQHSIYYTVYCNASYPIVVCLKFQNIYIHFKPLGAEVETSF